MVWLTLSARHPTGSGFFKNLSAPDGWLMHGSLWLSVALTVISGANYLWSSRYLLRGK
jgi:hypothetical protein